MGLIPFAWRGYHLLHRSLHPQVQVAQTKQRTNAKLVGLFPQNKKVEAASTEPILSDWQLGTIPESSFKSEPVFQQQCKPAWYWRK